MKINENILRVLQKSSITNKKSALAFLLAVYFKCSEANCFPELLKANISSLGIYSINGNNVEWKIPLFENQDVNFEWVKEYRQKFKDRNPARAGDLKACTIRMKDFFANNPHVRKEDVLKATDKYLDDTDKSYIQTSHYFIFKGKGVDRTSSLEGYVEDVIAEKTEVPTTVQGINRMID